MCVCNSGCKGLNKQQKSQRNEFTKSSQMHFVDFLREKGNKKENIRSLR